MRIHAATTYSKLTAQNQPAAPAEEKTEAENEGLSVNTASPEEPVDGLVFTLNGERVATVVDKKESLASKVLSGTGAVLGATARGLVDITSADPSFALTQVARIVEPLVLRGLPRDSVSKYEMIYPGVLKGISAGMNVKKWIDRRRRSELAKMNGTYDGFDKMGEIVDTGHLAADAVGIAGALTQWLAPASGWGGQLLGISLAADIAVYSYHAIEYIGTRDENPDEPPPNG